MLNSNNSDIDKELEMAVYKDGRDLEKVKALFEGNVNLEMGMDKGPLLYYVSSVEVTKELLFRGAYVNRTNMYRETPLHSAITRAVEKRNLKVIKALLECGGDINIRNRQYRSTPLDNAVYCLARGKLLIKFALINNLYNRDYRTIVDLTPHKHRNNYSELSRYLDDCVCEIVQMKTDKVYDNLSLYEFVIMKSTRIKTLHPGNKIAEQVILTNYPIYEDIISDNVNLWRLERASLLNKLGEFQIYMGSDISNQDVKEKDVILNFDSTYNIAKYLSNDDLLNFVTAFYKHTDQCLDFSVNLLELSQQPDTKLDEESASSCAKRARLESSHYE